MSITLKQKASGLDNELETVTSLFMGRIGSGEGILLESAEVDGRWGRYSVAAGDFLMVARSEGGRLKLEIKDQRLSSLIQYQGLPYMEGLRLVMDSIVIEPDKAAAALPPITRALYGYLGYDAAGLMEPKLSRALQMEAGAEGVFALAGNVYLFDHRYNRLTNLSLIGGKPPQGATKPAGHALGHVKTGPISSTFSRENYIKAVEEIRELIRQGECIQVVLSTRFSAPFSGSLFDVYRRLRRINASPYMFYLDLPEIKMAFSSPEVMISCDRGRLRLCPIAGTKPRGRTPQEDSLLGEQLINDPKERAEHVMLVDLGRNDLGRVAAPGTVKVERYMEIERFSHVMHLTSQLSAQLETGRHALDVVAATFPAGTLSGAPKVRAMEIIARYEPCPRGPYGGALGWLGLDKDEVSLDLGINIRGLWQKDGRVHWQSGGGLVYYSNPEREWNECLEKSLAPRTALEAAGGE